MATSPIQIIRLSLGGKMEGGWASYIFERGDEGKVFGIKKGSGG
jgi:hypothetical protein